MLGSVRRYLSVFVVIAAFTAPLLAGNANAKSSLTITARVPSSYRLVALSKTGELSVGAVKKGVTTIVPPASNVTLHLVSMSGSYAGPVVVGKKKVSGKTRAILGVKAGASLGRISYKSAGYGVATPKASSILSSVYANASSSGVPYGAGSLGFVSSVSQKSVSASGLVKVTDDGNAGSDPDKDGIPNAVDVDDNGDGQLDVVDDKTMAANTGKTGPRPYIFSDFFVDLADIIRVSDAASASATRELVKRKLKFVFGTSAEFDAVQNVRIDCLGISWCTTATVHAPPGSPTVAWSSVDKDGDGKFFDLNTLVVGSNKNFDSSINPNVYPSEVRPGQMFNFEIKYVNGNKVTVPSALTAFFVTAPAPSLIGATPISYPVQAGTGTINQPIPTANGTTLRIETFRPMRPLMPNESESAGMKEMGGLKYWVTVSRMDAGIPPTACSAEAYTGFPSTMAMLPSGPQPQLKDTSEGSSPANPVKIAFSVDLAKCNIANVTPGTKFYVDLNVGDSANNHSVANFWVVTSPSTS